MTPTAETLVVDASVAIKWHLVDEDHVHEAAELLARYMRAHVELIAPSHIRYEVSSALIVATQGKTPRLSVQDGYEAIQEFLLLKVRTIDTNDLILATPPLVQQYTIAFYDALYLALSRMLNVPFITADNKLYQRIKSLPGVIWLGDYR